MSNDHYNNYEMYTDEGDVYVAEQVNDLIIRGMAGGFERVHLLGEIRAMIDSIAKVHGEVYDTEPEANIAEQVNERLCKPQGWLPVSRFDW